MEVFFDTTSLILRASCQLSSEAYVHSDIAESEKFIQLVYKNEF
jgi:hypothetical protein